MPIFWRHSVNLRCVLLTAVLIAAPSVLLADDPPAGEDREALFKKLDANSDGQLTSDEVPEEQQRLFKRMLRTSDKDGDGKLTHDEFLAATKEQPRAAAPEGGGGGGGQNPEQLEALFKSRDANSDGKLVVEEVPEERREGFLMLIERFDADGDKALTLVEFSKGMAAMRSGQGGRPDSQRPDGQRSEGRRPGDGSPGNREGGGPESLFRALDSNGDGKISREETYTVADSLKKLDKDGDGAVSRSEAGLGGPPPRDGRPGGPPPGAGARAVIERNDKNSDGKLSKEEAPEFLARGFDRADTNSDGFLDQAELEQAFQAMAAMRGGQGGQGQGGQQFFKQLDKDGDGKLSKEEAPERMKENFDRLDANGDGFIVIEEFQRAMGAMRGQGGAEGARRPGGDAGGQGGAAAVEARFKDLDKDGDGKISKDEAPERMRDNFDRIDANSDGFIDLSELRQMMSAGRGRGGDGAKRPPKDDSN